MYMTNTFLFLKTLRLEAGTRAISVTPHAARLLRRRRIAAQPAAVSLGTTAADLSRTRVILAGRRDITIAGSAALTRQLLLTCQPAQISLGTSEAILQRTRLAGFIKTEITIEPQPARMLRNLVLKALPATVELTPNVANFLKVMGSIEAQPQTITIEGRAADLRAKRLLTAAPAAIEVTPQAAQLRRSYPLSAMPGGLVLTPRPAILRLSRRLVAVKQDISLSPKSADLTKSKVGVATFMARTSNPADLSTYTFTNQNVGGDGVKTVTVVIAVSVVGGGSMSLTGCTIGGVAATLLTQGGSGSSSSRAALYQRTYVAAAGATTTIAFTQSGGAGAAQRGGIGIWCLEGFSPTAYDTDAGFATNAAVNMLCDVPALGVAICTSTDSDPTVAPAITGVTTTRYSFDMETTDYQLGGDYLAGSAEINRAFSAPARTRTAVAACVASFAVAP